jgi:hypothetical protein
MTDEPTNSTPEQDEPTPAAENFSMGEVDEAVEVKPLEPEVPPMSISDKMIGIYSDPEPVYTNVKLAGPRATDWLIPMGLFIVAMALVMFIKFSNPAFVDEIQKQQMEAMQDKVDSGDMSEEQANAAMDALGSMGATIMMISTIVGVVIGIPIVYLLVALICWLFLKFAFKGSATFYLVFVAIALVSYILVLDQLLALLLSYITGNQFASFSPALFMETDLKSSAFKLMSSLNPITIWALFVLSIGFAKVSEISKGKTYALVFGIWIIVVVFSAFG